MFAVESWGTSVRGVGLAPITSTSAGLGVIRFMKAALAFPAMATLITRRRKLFLCRWSFW
jgi:hypothetical protein